MDVFGDYAHSYGFTSSKILGHCHNAIFKIDQKPTYYFTKNGIVAQFLPRTVGDMGSLEPDL